MVDVPLDPKRSSAPIKHNQNSTHRRGMSTRSCAFRGLNMTNAKKLRTHLLTGIESTLLLAGAATPAYQQVAPPEGEHAPGSLEDDPPTGPVGADGSETKERNSVVGGTIAYVSVDDGCRRHCKKKQTKYNT